MATSKLRLILLLALALAVLSPALARAQSPVEQTDCKFEGPETHEIFCAYLNVPERRGANSGRNIKLYFAQITSRSPQPAQPVIFLVGGPGANGVYYDSWMDVILENHDLYLLDQRGTGHSQPTLNCPELGQAAIENPLQVCYDRLKVKEGLDLDAYNSTESASDIDDLRKALGVSQWTLYGTSYGSRLALTVMRDHAESVQSAILDAAYPLQVNLWEEQGPNALVAFEALFKGCAADIKCDSAYPNLRDEFYATIARLTQTPVTFTYTDPVSSEPYEVSVDGNALVDQTFGALYDRGLIPFLPGAIHAAAQGDYQRMYSLFSGYEVAGLGLRQEGEQVDVSFSEGMNASVKCREELPFNDLGRAIKRLETAPEAIRAKLVGDAEYLFSDCEIWRVTPAGEIETMPVQSSIPTLILNGEYDPITPPAWGQIIAESLTTTYNFTFTNVGHGVINTSSCANRIVVAFLEDPTQEPNANCIRSLPPPDFRVP